MQECPHKTELQCAKVFVDEMDPQYVPSIPNLLSNEEPTAKHKGKCVHGKQRCKPCKVGLCVHDNYRNQCRMCGKGFCMHGRRKDRCRDCHTGFCIHNGWKYDCDICKGKPNCASKPRLMPRPIAIRSICMHNTLQYQCEICIIQELVTNGVI